MLQLVSFLFGINTVNITFAQIDLGIWRLYLLLCNFIGSSPQPGE